MFVKIYSLLLLCLLQSPIDGSKILSVFTAQSYSHYIFIEPLLKQLAERGHEITSITPYPQKQPVKNFRDIAVLQQFKGFADEASDTQRMRDMSLWQLFELMHDISCKVATSVLEQHEIQQLISDPTETFDLIIMDVCFDEAFFGFAPHFRAPMIGVATFGAHSWNTALTSNTGAPTLPSFMPYPFFSYTNSMNFGERLYNFYAYAFEYFYMYYIHLPRHEKLYEQYFGHTGHSLASVQRNFSVILLNEHSSLGVSRPYVPNMIDVGGMQVSSKIHTLPSNMQQFLDNATAGAIYFSLGSNIKSETLSSQRLNAILNVFRALPQRILWKFEVTNLIDKPDNVFIGSWFPQADVLAHPNIKLFITHGGHLSITEALVRGKPVLGIPFYADQFMNVVRAKKMGYALSLDFNELSELSFLHAIQELLSNSSYAQMAQTLSQRYHDKPQSAMETAIFWVEYVLRQRGALHLRCAGVDLNIFQYYGLDVFALVLLVIMAVIFGVHFLCHCCSVGNSKKTKLKMK